MEQPADSASEGISPNDLHKGAPDSECLRLAGSGKDTPDLLKDEANAGEVTEGPSVVIGWVLRDVIEWPSESTWQTMSYIDEKLKREVESEAHVARLFKCWEKHEESFAEVFVQEIFLLVTGLQGDDCTMEHRVGRQGKLVQVASFLADFFTSEHKGPDSQKLIWVSVLAGIRRKHDRMCQAGPEWAEGAALSWRGRMVNLLWELQLKTCLRPAAKLPIVNGIGNCSLYEELVRLWGELSKVHTEAHKEFVKVNKARTVAELKASLSRAPWEEEAEVLEKAVLENTA